MKQVYFDRLMAVVTAEGNPGEREGPLPRIEGQVVVGRPGAGWPVDDRLSSPLSLGLQFVPWQGWCSLANGVPTPWLAPLTAGRREERPSLHGRSSRQPLRSCLRS
jgi:hypothetical protein